MNKITEIHLTEYRALREEQKTRLTMNSTILNVIVLVVGGELAAYVQMVINNKTEFFVPLLLLSPILTTPLILIYYDNQFMVYRIGRYFTEELYNRIKALSDQDIFGWEGFHHRSSGQLALVAFGRNSFFVLVTVAPLIIFFIFRVEGPQILQSSFAKMAIWESWAMAFDSLLLIAVLITWIHSGIMFHGIGKSYKISPIKKKAQRK